MAANQGGGKSNKVDGNGFLVYKKGDGFKMASI